MRILKNKFYNILNGDVILLKADPYLKIFPEKNIKGVVCDIGDVSLKEEFAREYIFFRNLSLYTYKIKYSEKAPIIFINPNYGKLEDCIRIIKLFNQTDFPVFIYAEKKIVQKTSSYSNNNIQLFSLEILEKHQIETSLIISFNYQARYFINHLLPVMIVGPEGFGGLIDKKNLKYNFAFSFQGRPGGEIDEYLPINFIIEEINRLKRISDISTFLLNNKIVLTKLVDKRIKTLHKSDLKKYIRNTRTFRDVNKRIFLKPKIVSNVYFHENNFSIFVKRKGLNDTLFNIPADQMQFIRDLNGKHSFQHLISKYSIEGNHFWAIMNELFERKAITVHE